MSGHHLHLALNHIPVLGLLFATGILAYAVWRDQDAAVRISLGLFVVSGLGAVAAYLTGEEAEEVVENVANIPHSVIEVHEEMGLIALIAGATVGAIAIGVLIWRRSRPVPKSARLGVLAIGLIATGILGYTANLGGQIRHPELRDDAQETVNVAPADEEAEEEDDDH
ncbi:DUF2231 domain-containing protein [Longibacter salinarum]|uniref:DUF2231 domain-containing protein n=1 Tax=Longibacter salinarum TaxID=1850348 RepID=UPI0015CF498B|nr:DUF2231 domain-containing protein [Longibacter salinarum]